MHQRILADRTTIQTEDQALQEITYRLLYLQMHPTQNHQDFMRMAEDLLEKKLLTYTYKLSQNNELFQQGALALDRSFEQISYIFNREQAFIDQYRSLSNNLDKALYRCGQDILNLVSGKKQGLHYDLALLHNRLQELTTLIQDLRTAIGTVELIQEASTYTSKDLSAPAQEFTDQANQLIDRAFHLYLQIYLHAQKINNIYLYYYGTLPQKYTLPSINRESLSARHQFYYDVLRNNNRTLFLA